MQFVEVKQTAAIADDGVSGGLIKGHLQRGKQPRQRVCRNGKAKSG